MKTLNPTSRRAVLALALMALPVGGCDTLAVEPASEFAGAFLRTAGGLRAVLNSAYRNIQFNFDDGSRYVYVSEGSTDLLVNFRGALNRDLRFFEQLNWDADHPWIRNQFWPKPYAAIRDANVVLENVEENEEMTAAQIAVVKGEARYIRAQAYTMLYEFFGPVPLVKSTRDDAQLPRATEEEILAFVESELLAAADALPPRASEYGRATRGAALGILARFQLNTRQWQKAAETSKRVMDLGVYSLFPDYTRLFSIENEGNAEMVWVWPAVAQQPYGNIWMANAYPPLYPNPFGLNTATQIAMPVPFYHSFAANDVRRKLILTEYVNTQGQRIDLLAAREYQHPRSFKYPPDPNADTRAHGNDLAYLRFADVLLIRAEALAMVQGPNPETVELLNRVRRRAGVAERTLADFPTRDALISAILQERAWEFYSEGTRRQDLIRHDRYITNARQRGIAAEDFRVRLPIPQDEMDANPNLVQNPGY